MWTTGQAPQTCKVIHTHPRYKEVGHRGSYTRETCTSFYSSYNTAAEASASTWTLAAADGRQGAAAGNPGNARRIL